MRNTAKWVGTSNLIKYGRTYHPSWRNDPKENEYQFSSYKAQQSARLKIISGSFSSTSCGINKLHNYPVSQFPLAVSVMCYSDNVQMKVCWHALSISLALTKYYIK